MLNSTDFLERTLLEEGVISSENLAEAQKLIEETSSTFEEALIALGYIDGRKIALIKAGICESAYIDINYFEFEFDNAKRIPRAFAEQHRVFPLFIIDGAVTLGTDDPLNLGVLDQVRQMLKCEIDAVQCQTSALIELIDRAYSLTQHDLNDEEIATGDGTENEDSIDAGPIVSAVNTLLIDAIKEGASDVHINPDQHELLLRFRVDGVLHQRQGPPLSMHKKIVQRLKVMAHLDLTQTRRPQDGKIRFECKNSRVDIRVSILPTVTGENVVLRLLANDCAVKSLDDLGMDEHVREKIKYTLAQPYGMMLVTGPTGSGKTTSLYTALSILNTPDRNIITVEDPVEIRLAMVRQVQANSEIGLSFANALRAILRQDPDVILVGEIRDEETAGIALQASLTGHFVLSTLHTNDAAGSISRLIDFNQPPFVINSALLGILAQRLVRRICSSCAKKVEIDKMLLAQFGLNDSAGLMSGAGCRHCMQTGFHGRVGVYEMMKITPALQTAILEHAPTEKLRNLAIEDGMKPMWVDGVAKARIGQTSLQELLKVVPVGDNTHEEDNRRKCA